MKIRKNLAFILLAVLLVAAIAGTSVAYMFKRTDNVENQFEPALVACEMVDGEVSITNTGTIDAYLRIRLVTYWVDADGNIVDKPSPELNITHSDMWVSGSDNTYYYKVAVAPGTSVNLASAVGGTVDVSDQTKQVVEIFGEAIQSQPANAAQSAWGVQIENNIIKNAP